MQLPRGIYLAPMVRGSDLAARALARDRGGASLCYSPMLRDREVAAAVAGMALGAAGDPDRLRRDGGGEGARGGAMRAGVRVDKAGRTDPVEETAYLLLQSHQDDAKNLVVQLCGSDPAAVARATTAVLDVYSREHGALPLGIDLNLGCPQEGASAEGFGAFLVERDPDAAVACVAAMRCAIDSYISDALRPPLLSAKIRLLNGSVDDTINFVRRLKVAGVDYVAIHCRYRTDKHTGDADWDAGGQVVAALSSELPIVINGGISNYEDAASVLERTKCHAVMVATGHLRNHRQYEPNPDPETFEPHHLALEYLDFVETHPPPSHMYVQKRLRWIFRDALHPEDDPAFDGSDYSDWRVKLGSFLVRPYMRSVEQFRLFVALYIRMSGRATDDGRLPESIRRLVQDVSFGSVRKVGKTRGLGGLWH